MTDDDPLDGADIGETATVRETTHISVWGLRDSDRTAGSDRLADTEVVDIAVRTDEHGEPFLVVMTETEVTKRLPRRWDESDAPRTDSERRKARRKKWGGRIATGLTTAVVLGIGFTATHAVNEALAGEVSVNGEPLPEVSLVPVAVVFLLAAFVVFALPRLPRPGPRGDRR